MISKEAESGQKISSSVFEITGMHCSSCVSRVEKNLLSLKGVEKASINLVTGLARIEYDSQITGPAELKKVIENTGYKAKLINEIEQKSISETTKKTSKNYLTEIKLIVSVILTVIVVFISMGKMAGLELPLSDFHRNILLASISLPVFVWCGWEFHAGAISSALRGSTDMNTLISIGTSAAYFFSLIQIIFPVEIGANTSTMFDSSVTIITIILIGRYIEKRATQLAGKELFKIVSMRPPLAHIEINGQIEDIPAQELGPGDIVVVHPGEKVPLDGIIIEGSGSIDESLVTGESMPVSKGIGETVTGGTTNVSGLFKMRVTKKAGDTFLSRVVRAVQEAQASKPQIGKIADKIASVFVPAVLGISIFTFLMWMIAGGENRFPTGFTTAISVLVIACPCALGLATPAAISVAVGRAAKMGVFIRRGEILEKLPRADIFAFDKTGTLTISRPRVFHVQTIQNYKPSSLLTLAASVESGSSHPFSIAINHEAKKIGQNFLEAKSIESIPGKGMSAIIDNEWVHVGSEKYMEMKNIQINELMGDSLRFQEEGKSVVFVAHNSKAIGFIVFEDPIREEAPRVISEIKKGGFRTLLLSGDSENACKFVQRKLGIDEYHARLLPDEKSKIIAEIQKSGKKVAMIGDGINDAPALAIASSGSIAISTSENITLENADAGLKGTSLEAITKFLNLSKKTIRVIKQNFFWAFIYNIIAIPVAGGILYPFTGIILDPIISACAMSLSSISVVLSSLRLKWFNLA